MEQCLFIISGAVVGVPARGTADLIWLKLHSSTSVILCKITKAEGVYIGQPENIRSLLVSTPLFIDRWGKCYTMVA